MYKRQVFTENDEAWGLLVLEDNWEMWWDMAAQDYRKCMRERNVDREIGSEEESSLDTNGVPRSEEEDVFSVGGGTVDCQRIARRVVLTQLYSSKRTLGLSQLGFDRLEVLEEKVHQDRCGDGHIFYDYVKLLYLRDQGELEKGQRKVLLPEQKQGVLRMM